jgi:hypothetical protein
MTNNWITILTFTFPHEAHLAKTKLESEGFEVMIKDELTIQVDNFYSNAIGGVKLQVQETDFDAALQVLKDSGYILEPPKKDHAFLLRVNAFTGKLPFMGKLILEFRLLILATLALLLVIVPIVLITLPSVKEQLIRKSWCFDRLTYKGRHYQPNSAGVKIVFGNQCTETFFFDDQGSAYLPGFNTYPVNAKWKMEGSQVVIYNSDTFQNIYNGRYSVEINENTITMRSDSTTITGYSNR